MKLYLIAGEASGDLHASDLLREITNRSPGVLARAWGGDLLAAEGAHIVKHYRELAFMGFTEVAKNLRTILRNIEFCKADILSFRPDAIVLIDYPGFNMRIAEFAKKSGIPVYYYISPQVWAWKASRVKKIRETVRKMFVILPFEKDFYKKFGYDVEYVGHPLTDVISRKEKTFSTRGEFLRANNLSDKPIIALLPGSRRQEVAVMLPLMLSVKNAFPEHQWVVARAPSLPASLYHKIIGDENIPVINDTTYELLHHADAALVTSGTATLETALLNVPQVVCYKGGRISYLIARSLVKIRYISLVNLILEKEAVQELIQHALKTDSLVTALRKILNPDVRKIIFSDYAALKHKLKLGGAAARTAGLILQDMKDGIPAGPE